MVYLGSDQENPSFFRTGSIWDASSGDGKTVSGSSILAASKALWSFSGTGAVEQEAMVRKRAELARNFLMTVICSIKKTSLESVG